MSLHGLGTLEERETINNAGPSCQESLSRRGRSGQWTARKGPEADQVRPGIERGLFPMIYLVKMTQFKTFTEYGKLS